MAVNSSVENWIKTQDFECFWYVNENAWTDCCHIIYDNYYVLIGEYEVQTK